MKRITETCKPRPDVLRGLDDRHFAAQLDRVVADDPGYEAYTNPAKFFDLTHPTTGLRELIREVFGHITGTGGRAILRAQTSFGGGKTHSLIALYHLARGHRPDKLPEYVKGKDGQPDAKLPDEPVRVAALVGDVLDPVNGTTASGRTTYTLWGEIASQLGDDAWAAMEQSDATRTAPGTEVIAKMMAGGPALIVIDEVAQYLKVCATSGSEDVRRQAGAVAPFLKNLSEVVQARDDVALVVTLATRDDAYGDETEQVRGALDAALKDTKSVSARKGGDVEPATETEIAEILKTRLFEETDDETAKEAATAYAAYYETVAVDLGMSPSAARDVAERIETTYPFHPALVDVLDKRIGTIPNFQRARGALRLLSRVIAAVWADADNAPQILNVGDLPLADDSVVRELTVRIGRDGFQQVAQADIGGSNAHARSVDDKHYQGRPVARRAAICVFAHSLEQTAAAGAGANDIALGILRPGDNPELVEDALGRLYERAWHLTFDNVRWKFQTEPNANRIVSDEADRVPSSRLSDERAKLLARMLRNTSAVATHIYPEDLDTIPDERKLHLAVPHHDTVAVTAKNADSTPAVLVEARKRHGGSPRQNRNGIAYLVADADKITDMDRAIRRMLAANAITDDDARMAGYAESVQKTIRKIADTSLLEAHVAVGRCYKHLYYPAANGPGGDMAHIELTANVQGAIGEKISRSASLPEGKAWTDQVWQSLVAAEKVRASDKPLAADWVKKKAWPKSSERVRTTEILDVFWRDHSAPLLTDVGPVTQAIQAGVLAGMWVVQDMRGATDGRGKVWSNRDGNTPRPVSVDDDVWLIDHQTAVEEGLLASPTSVADVAKVVDKAGEDAAIYAPDMRKQIEQAKGGHEPTKQEIREALAEAVRQQRVAVYKGETSVTAGDLSGDKVGFDDLVVKPYPDDVVNGVGPKILRTKHHEGAAATAAEKLISWVDDLIAGGHTDGLVEVTVTVEVSEDTPNVAGTLVTMLGSVPNVDASLNAEITYGIDGVEGEVTVAVAGADRRQAQQKVGPLLKAVTDRAAAPLDGKASLTFTLDEPHAPDSPAVKGLISAVTTYFVGAVRLTGRVA